MKKQKSIKLALNKKSISDLNKEVVQGGLFTTGCSDGCSPFPTILNCTQTNCTADCNGGTTFNLFCGPFHDY